MTDAQAKVIVKARLVARGGYLALCTRNRETWAITTTLSSVNSYLKIVPLILNKSHSANACILVDVTTQRVIYYDYDQVDQELPGNLRAQAFRQLFSGNDPRVNFISYAAGLEVDLSSLVRVLPLMRDLAQGMV